MNEIEKRGEYPTTSYLAKLGLTAVGCTAGGVFLFILQALSRFRVLGLIVGAAACVLGIVSITSKDPEDRKPGAIIMAAGVLAVLSRTGIPLLRTAAGTLLSIGAIGLLAIGIWKGIKFFIELKKRS